MPLDTKGILRAGLFFLACLTFASSPKQAPAQTIDYGSLEELFGEPVTTSATGKPQKSSDAPVALEIITAEEIRRHGVASIPEILNRVAGLTSWQASRSFADVGIRGQNAPYNPTILVLLNGRQVYSDVYGYTDWSLIPVQMEEIRQIEVVKGPTTALYGFNAANGVVNIVTYNPKYDDFGEAGVTVGTGQYRRGHVFETFQLSDRASVRISGSLEKFDEFDLSSRTSYAQTGSFVDANNKKLLIDGLFQLTDKTQLRLEGSYAGAVGSDTPPTYYAVPDDKFFKSGKISVISDTSLGLIEASLYNNDMQLDFTRESALGPNIPFFPILENQITIAQVQDLFKVGTNHTFRLQAEYRHNAMQSDKLIAPGSEVSYEVAAAGGMWSWSITPTLEWTNALRVDHFMLERKGDFAQPVPFPDNNAYDKQFTDYSANSGIAWNVTERDTLRASYGRGIQAPSLVQLGAFVTPFGPSIIITGNPGLGPVIVHNYEVGYERLIDQIDGKIRGSVFYRRTEDINSIGANTFLTGSTVINQAGFIGDSGTAGFEVGLEGKINPHWNWDASYIYQNIDDDFIPSVSTDPTPVALHYEGLIPHHVIKAHLGYAAGAWEADLYGEVASEFNVLEADGIAFNTVPMDGYYTLGGRVAYTFANDLTVALMGSDLTQPGVSNNYGLENERRAFVQVSKKF